jgi:hypothetical protein
MKTNWMIDEPIDFEYQKYKMLGYFQKMAQELDIEEVTWKPRL